MICSPPSPKQAGADPKRVDGKATGRVGFTLTANRGVSAPSRAHHLFCNKNVDGSRGQYARTCSQRRGRRGRRFLARTTHTTVPPSEAAPHLPSTRLNISSAHQRQVLRGSAISRTGCTTGSLQRPSRKQPRRLRAVRNVRVALQLDSRSAILQ